MGIQVGTIVTRHNACTSDLIGQDLPILTEGIFMGACVGRIVEIEPDPNNPDNPAIEVIWWQTCKWHHRVLPKDEIRYAIDELWEIGRMV